MLLHYPLELRVDWGGRDMVQWEMANDFLVWEAAAEDERNQKDGKIAEQVKLVEEIRRRKEEIRKTGTKDIPGSSL
jgi:hypothetical protein